MDILVSRPGATMELNERKLDDGERAQQRLIKLLRERGPIPRRLSANERRQVFRAVSEQAPLLAFRRDGIERFLGNAGVMPDGRAVIVFPRQPLEEIGRLDFLVWGSPFGACLRVMMPLKGDLRQVAVLPNDGAFEALRAGRLLVACFRMGTLEEAVEADYSAQSDVLAALSGLLDMTVDAEAEIAAQCILDPTLVRLDSVGKMFTPAYGRLEWLQAGWLKACRDRYRMVANAMSELAAHAAAALPNTPLAEIPVIGEVAKTAAGSGSLTERYHSVKVILRDAKQSCEAIERIFGIYPPAETHAREVLPVLSGIFDLCCAMELDPLLSDAGRRQMYLDTHLHSMNGWTLRPEEFPLTEDEAAREYWQCKLLQMLLLDGALYLDPCDMPISPVELIRGWDVDKPSIDIHQAHKASSHLLDEATALRRWTIPQRAFVELKVGPFIGVELTEVHDEVYFVWRAASNRYWLTSLGPWRQTFANPLMLPEEKGGEEAAAVMETLMAALVRDFWVAEERHKIFDVRRRLRVGAKGGSKGDRHYVYLPRARYVSSGLHFDRLNEKLEYALRARHFVRPFLRKVENPSPVQVEIARRENVRLPEGFTYVRGHYRGGGESQAIYRSRSAISLLYDVFEPQMPAVDESLASNWFTFERAVAVLLEDHLGFTVRHKAVRGKGDAGVDILAEKTTGQVMEIWAVQCKFYAPKGEIGPSIVRELIGSLADISHDSTQAVRGMIVTTSYFTPDALRLAVKHGIQTVDGKDLNAICSAVNRRVN
jgi:hypothetical protein